MGGFVELLVMLAMRRGYLEMFVSSVGIIVHLYMRAIPLYHQRFPSSCRVYGLIRPISHRYYMRSLFCVCRDVHGEEGPGKLGGNRVTNRRRVASRSRTRSRLTIDPIDCNICLKMGFGNPHYCSLQSLRQTVRRKWIPCYCTSNP